MTTKSKVDLTCVICGSPFSVSRYESDVRGRRACSAKCRAAMQRKPVPTKDHLESLYGAGMSIAQLSVHYKVSKGTISGWFQQLGIATRPANAGLRSMAGRRRPRARSGRRAVLGGLYVRSSWECNYALVLNHAITQGLVEHWEYEADTFEFPVKRGSRHYTPDFKVFYPNGTFDYHEVKAYMDQPSRTKLKRMAKYYPGLRVRLIDSPIYRQFASQYAHVLEGWET